MTDFKSSKRIVIKIGTSSLTYETGKFNLNRIDRLVKVISDFKNSSTEVVLVSSGAVTAGIARLGINHRPHSIEEKQAMLGEVRALADVARQYGVTVAFEFHRKTLNDCGDSCVEFLRELGDTRVKTYWQPFFEGNDAENLSACLSYVDAVHVFSWDAAAHRFPLDAKGGEWREFIKTALPVCRDYILEFVVNDDEDMFMRDAATLKSFFE